MTFEINTDGHTESISLDVLADKYSGIITIGRKCDEVWNAVAIDDDSIDMFQCHIIGFAGSSFRLNEGQNRTDCPIGLKSSYTVPCQHCSGSCTGTCSSSCTSGDCYHDPLPQGSCAHGKPKYFPRTPMSATLVNGAPIGKYGTILSEGDVITIGHVTINVR